MGLLLPEGLAALAGVCIAQRSGDAGAGVRLMEQRRRSSAVEAVTNTAVGFLVAILAQVILFPLWGVASLSVMDNAEIAAVFMALSVPRGYLIRRFFEWLRVTGRMP
jgi:hypothetical protein